MRRFGTPWTRWLVLALAVVVVVLWPLPAWLTRHPSHGLSAAEQLKATNDVRATLVQALAGLALLGGLFYTARTSWLGAKNFDLALQQQLTDRYTKAVEQLGNEKLDVRLGGIYALERLMVDSPRDHPTIVEVLAAFLRGHAIRPTGAATPVGSGHNHRPPVVPMPSDTDAVASVIARRPPGRVERYPLDLRSCYLSGADLSRANLIESDLTGAILSRVNLSRADLTDAILSGADLTDAILSRAILTGAVLTSANLSRTLLSDVDLTDATLSRANLTGAILSHANLSRADLSQARGLTAEQLSVAGTIEGASLPSYLASDHD